MANKELTSVLLSGLAVTGGVLATVATGGAAPIAGLIFTGALAAIGSIGGNLLSSYLEKKFVNPTPKDEILKNGDLTRAVGKAIFILINDEAKNEEYGSFRDIIKTVGKNEGAEWEAYLAERLKEWEKYVKENIDNEAPVPEEKKSIYSTLEKLLPAQLTKYIKAREGKIDDLQALTPETWAMIVQDLFRSESYQPDDDVCLKLGTRLHQNFPQALRKVLIDDFDQGGKAFASMIFRLLSEAAYYSKANYEDSQEIKQKLDALIIRIDQVDALNQSSTIALDDKFWQEAFNLQKDIKEITSETLQRVIRIESTQKEHTEKLNQILELLVKLLNNRAEETIALLAKQQFLPKNFPQSLIYFTGRKTVLENITECLKNHGTAAFADTHGVGKSSVVIEFAYRNQENYKHVLFIRATNNEFNIYVSEIVKDLGIAMPEDAKPEQRLEVLQDWLATNQDWLLLVDNVDDVDFIHKCGFNKPNGNVIYTSNDEKIFKVGTQVKLPIMTDENAMLLLYKHWQDEPDVQFENIPEKAHPALKGIAEKFGNHPFSMAFVGSYLAEEDESLEEFLEAYQSKEKNLLEKYKFLSGYQHENVAAAFLLRFEQISTPKDETDREQFLSIAVKDYLKLSAYVGTDNIPEEILQESLILLHPDQIEWTGNKDFIKDIYKRFKPTSIFKRDAENKTLTTHRIVQEIMRFQIKAEEDLLLEALATGLDYNFEYFSFTNKENVERHLLHVGVFLAYLELNRAKDKNLKLENEFTARLSNKYALYFAEYGQYKKAEKYCIFSKEICESIEDFDQNQLAISYNQLAKVYLSQGKFAEARIFFEKDLVICEKVLGEDHPNTAETYDNLAKLCMKQNDFKGAEPYLKKSLEIREKILGLEHPSTATSYSDLAVLNTNQGKYEDAEFYLKKAIEIFEKTLGENHPWTLRVYVNLSALYINTENFALAKEYQQKSLNARLAFFGENHPDVANNYAWLGGICFREDKYREGLDYFYKAREIFLRFLPIEHPSVQNVQSWIDDGERFVGG